MELLKPQLEPLERFALSLCRNRNSAKDLVSETILLALEKFDTLKNKQAFLKWIFTILHRQYITGLRRIIKYRNEESINIDLLFGESLSADDLVDLNMLYTTIDELNPVEKSAILLFEIMGYPIVEIAEIQDTTVSNIKVRLHRARKHLKQKLGIIKEKNNLSI